MSASKANRSALSSGKKGSTASPDGKAKRGSVAPFIPFAQRQARSQVAAHETLKRGKNVSRYILCVSKPHDLYAGIESLAAGASRGNSREDRHAAEGVDCRVRQVKRE
jgi:hypothetical protein